MELYVDMTDGLNGGDWKLVHSFIDKESAMMPSGGKTVPSECPVQGGDPVLGPRRNCFLRSDGSATTEVHWKEASIEEIMVSRAIMCIFLLCR